MALKVARVTSKKECETDVCSCFLCDYVIAKHARNLLQLVIFAFGVGVFCFVLLSIVILKLGKPSFSSITPASFKNHCQADKYKIKGECVGLRYPGVLFPQEMLVSGRMKTKCTKKP